MYKSLFYYNIVYNTINQLVKLCYLNYKYSNT